MFLSNAGDLTGNTVDNGMHIFRRDMQADGVVEVDVDTNGVGSTDFAGTFPSVSTNGQFIAFSGPDGGLVPLDINGANDVFVRDATGGTTELISQRNPPCRYGPATGYSSEGPLSISANGRWVAFASYANDLVPNDTNNARDVFVCDRWSGSNILVSIAQNGGCALGGDSMTPVISTNGQFVVFVSAATNLTAGNVITNPGTYNIYRRDLQAQTTVLVSVSTNGVQSGDNDSTSPVVSQDGRYVAFLSKALNLAPGLYGTEQSTFWCDLNGGEGWSLPEMRRNIRIPSIFSDHERGRAYVLCLSLTFFSPSVVWDTQLGTNIYTNSASSAAISPDGSRLLYQYRSTKSSGLGQRNQHAHGHRRGQDPEPGSLERRRAVCRGGYFGGPFGTGRQ